MPSNDLAMLEERLSQGDVGGVVDGEVLPQLQQFFVLPKHFWEKFAVGDGKERFGHCITADSGNSVGEISGHSQQINSVSIRQQRPLRAVTGSDDSSLVFYHGAPFKFNTSLREQHNRFVFGTAFSPDGSLFASVGADKRIWLYDGKTGEAKGQIGEGVHTGSIFGISWAKDSKKCSLITVA